MSFGPHDYLNHILAEADYLIASSEQVDRESFLTDETLRRAFVRSIEVIGEATKKLPDAITTDQSTVPWRSIAKMRDRLIHAYFGVDYELVWDVVKNNVPSLQQEVRRLLAKQNSDESL